MMNEGSTFFSKWVGAGDEHIRHLPVHIRLQSGKIWIEEDMTEDGVATWLLEQGVPHDDIVLAFQPPQMRPLTEFALA